MQSHWTRRSGTKRHAQERAPELSPNTCERAARMSFCRGRCRAGVELSRGLLSPRGPPCAFGACWSIGIQLPPTLTSVKPLPLAMGTSAAVRAFDTWYITPIMQRFCLWCNMGSSSAEAMRLAERVLHTMGSKPRCPSEERKGTGWRLSMHTHTIVPKFS